MLLWEEEEKIVVFELMALSTLFGRDFSFTSDFSTYYRIGMYSYMNSTHVHAVAHMKTS